MITLLDVIADLEKLASDLKAVHGTIWEKELQTFTPVGEEQTTELKPTLEEVRAISAQKSRAGLTKEVKAIIQGEFHAGEHCKFCKIKPTCRKRAEYHLSLARYDFAPPNTLDCTEISAILEKAAELVSWANDS